MLRKLQRKDFIKMYKLESNKKDYITQTQRKYFKYALDYVLKKYADAKKGIIQNAPINACKVNKIFYIFDFENKTVSIKSNQDDRFYKHNLIKVNE